MIMGKIRTNWNRNLVRYGERTARVGMLYHSVLDSLDCSAGFNGRKVIDWVGVSCSLRFLYLDTHPTGAEHETAPMRLFPTYFENSTDNTMWMGFHNIYMSQGSRCTIGVARIEAFDWQALIISI